MDNECYPRKSTPFSSDESRDAVSPEIGGHLVVEYIKVQCSARSGEQQCVRIRQRSRRQGVVVVPGQNRQAWPCGGALEIATQQGHGRAPSRPTTGRAGLQCVRRRRPAASVGRDGGG